MPTSREKHTKRRRFSTLLSHGRPPTFSEKPSLLPAKTSRRVIKRHHQLQKQRCTALDNDNPAIAEDIQVQIEAEGGLEVYQQASISGQSTRRGGDSSKVLRDWLAPARAQLSSLGVASRARWRMLEIGALSERNACSRSTLFDMTRIDLHPQNAHIQRQDFMQRPLPTSNAERFDIISLSLVLNYLASPLERGEMLLRTTKFLRHLDGEGNQSEFFPSLFLVLPAPCVANSRYLTEGRLREIMESMGYALVKWKSSLKLVYQLWKYDERGCREEIWVPKVEVNPGGGRNNFAIVRK